MMKRLFFLTVMAIAFSVLPASAQSFVGDITAAGATCGTTNACVTATLSVTPGSASNSATITLSGTFTATLQFEVSADGGVSWSSVGSSSSAGQTTVSVASKQYLRVRCSAYTSGTVTTTILATTAAVSGGGATWPLTSPSGASISSTSGSVDIAAGGMNQNITLTPSGTGGVTTLAQISASAITLTVAGVAMTFTGSTRKIRADSLELDNAAGGVGTEWFVKGVEHGAPNSVSCSGTCTVDLLLGNSVWITLTGAVTSVVLNNPKAGATYQFNWIQDATGRAVSGFPAAWHGISSPGSTASTYSSQSCDWNGSLAVCRAANTNIP